MPSYISKKLAFNNAEQFKESFSEETPTIGYVTIGNHLPYTNEASPNTIDESLLSEKSIWDNAYAGKRITGNDVELVIPRVDWASGRKYRQFDDTIDPSDLLKEDSANNIYPMYVINSQRNVYLCLCNNVSSNSTVEPTGQNFSSNGNIQTVGDGHLWKYLYNIRASNKFLANDWIPAPTSTLRLDFTTSSVISVDGELTKIVMTNNGNNYVHSNITVSSYTSGCTVLTVSNTTNLAANMSLTGTGIVGGTFISLIDTVNLLITISSATSSNGGGSGNTISVITRILIDGDGTEAFGTPTVNSTTQKVEKITLTSYGRNYTRSNVFIFGTGTSAQARVVLPPKYGHGFNPAKQLGASNVLLSSRIGEVDSTEGGIISSNTSFRQYSLLINAHKYGNNSSVVLSSANSVFSQTTNLTLLAGSLYNLNEFVFQGIINNPTFSGFVHDQTANEVRLTNVKGTISIGSLLKGNTTNPSGRAVTLISNPEFEPYTGDILYVNNIEKIDRTEGQAENIKFVVTF